VWLTADAVHIDLRGLEPPQLMVAILQTIDGGEVDTALVAHFDRDLSLSRARGSGMESRTPYYRHRSRFVLRGGGQL